MPTHACMVILQMQEQQLLRLDELCRNKGVKLLAARSYGLMGYMRVRELATFTGQLLPQDL